MDQDPSIKHSEFAQTVLGVLFSLTFGVALEQTLGGITHYQTVESAYDAFLAKPGTWLLKIAQLVAYLLTLSRFYIGAYRFLTCDPPRKTRVTAFEIIWNVVNVSLLFIGFYVAALLVDTRGMFLLFIAALHGLDLVWFGVGGPILNRTAATAKIRDYFIAFDVVTITAAAVVGIWFVISPFNPKWVQLWATVLLVGLFVIDVLFLCRDFYFEQSTWKTRAETERREDV